MDINAMDVYGNRKPRLKEMEYIKNLLLDFAEGKATKVSYWCIALCMAILPWIGIQKIVEAVLHMYGIEQLCFSDIVVEMAVCVVLVLIGIVGIFCILQEIKNIGKDTYRQDILQERFYVVDVEIVRFEKNPNLETSESLAVVRDLEENTIDHTFTTVNWQEISQTQKGLIVIFEKENGEQSIRYRVFPCYDENSDFCRKIVNR